MGVDPTLGLLGTFTILLFPDGHLPSPRWRWVGWLAAVSIGVLTFAAFVYPAGPASAPNPFALPGAKPLLDALQATIFLLIGAIILSLVSIVVRYRRGDRERREQLRWLMFAAGALVALYGVGNVAIELIAPVHNGAATPVWQQIYQDVTTVSYALIPIAIGFAVLKYRLYDIDVVISKTVQYGALALFIALVYTAVVVGVGNLLGARSANLGLSIAATAVVALAFDPVRRRVQRFANRLVYGDRATPYEVLARFSERVGGTFATEDVLPRTARVLAEGVGAARATVWLRSAGASAAGLVAPRRGRAG